MRWMQSQVDYARKKGDSEGVRVLDNLVEVMQRHDG